MLKQKKYTITVGSITTPVSVLEQFRKLAVFFILQKGIVTIPKSIKKHRVKENSQVNKASLLLDCFPKIQRLNIWHSSLQTTKKVLSEKRKEVFCSKFCTKSEIHLEESPNMRLFGHFY